MQPKLTLLTEELVRKVFKEATELLATIGIKVQNPEALQLLLSAGAKSTGIDTVRLPIELVYLALSTAPKSFHLFDYFGNPTVRYGGDKVQFDAGSSGTAILDPKTLQHKTAETSDLLRLIKVAESLPQYNAQSTMVVCDDVPKAIQDLYRLYLIMLHSTKPIVTGAFSNKNIGNMINMLSIFAGGNTESRLKPRAVFDVCPTPPLVWSNFACGNLMALARAGIPAEIVSMPLAGVAAPVTLIGAVTQHAAECLSGIVIHQLASAGSPIVWGGAPSIFDMRKGSTPMGAIETAMIDCSYAQVGKSLGLPTHAYLSATESKTVDVQAGLESGITAIIGALSGINMISGAGMVNSLLCQSPEKLVIDAESIAMAQRLLRGISTPTPTLATELFEGINFHGFGFLKQKITKELFQSEQHMPSSVIDRGSLNDWQKGGQLDAFQRAALQVDKFVAEYKKPELDQQKVDDLTHFVQSLSQESGLKELPQF